MTRRQGKAKNVPADILSDVPADVPAQLRSGGRRRIFLGAARLPRALLWALLLSCSLIGGPENILGSVLGNVPGGELGGGPSRAWAADFSGPVDMSADEVYFDDARDLVIANGNVEFIQGARVLQADTVTYNTESKIITATGNVVLLEPSGDIIFGEEAEVADDLRDGIIETIRLLMPDESRLAAARGTREDGVQTKLSRAVFSPCKLCQKDPTRPPLWQIKAVRVVHDQETHDISYTHAVMEFWGVPVIYLPYFSHPDPTVKQRSGFLAPTFGSDDDLGFILHVPYLWAIAPDKDAVIQPFYVSNENPGLAGEYRQRFGNGEIEIEGSITQASRRGFNDRVEEDRNRGHLRARGDFDHDETWRWGFDVNRATDDTYLRRYDFGNDDVLRSHLFAEAFRRQTYLGINSYAFQDLRAGIDDNRSPLVMPFIQYSTLSPQAPNGSYWSLDATALSLSRVSGTDMRRISLKGGWTLPLMGRWGDLWEFSASLQNDLYSVSDFTDPPAGTPGPVAADDFSGMVGRAFPQAMLSWRLPLVRDTGVGPRLLVEPIWAIIAGPNGGNSDNIPNEDSLAFEFDTSDLFTGNRFTGYDRVDSGQRVDYGLRMGVYGWGGGSTTAFLGRSFRFRDDTSFAGGSGLDKKNSDLVGRFQMAPHEYLHFLYRFRFDPSAGKARRNEANLSLGPPGLRLNSSYLFLTPQDLTQSFGEREELALNLSSWLTPNWQAAVYTRQDLADNGGTLNWGMGVGYRDECFSLRLDFRRSFTRDRDLEPSDAIIVQIGLKHLGVFSSDPISNPSAGP